jgi:hypothetical protein
MVMGENSKRIHVLMLTDAFIIRGNVTVPTSMRFSDALNKFLKNQQFIAVTDAEITLVYGGTTLEKRDFILINREQIIGISPQD